MTDKKRNFTFEEKNLLIDKVNKYKHIIDNKKSDAVSAAAKKRKWEEIAAEFNEQQGVVRTAEQLKKCYENMRAGRKKELEEEKRQRFLEIMPHDLAEAILIEPPSPPRIAEEVSTPTAPHKMVSAITTEMEQRAIIHQLRREEMELRVKKARIDLLKTEEELELRVNIARIQLINAEEELAIGRERRKKQ